MPYFKFDNYVIAKMPDSDQRVVGRVVRYRRDYSHDNLCIRVGSESGYMWVSARDARTVTEDQAMLFLLENGNERI